MEIKRVLLFSGISVMCVISIIVGIYAQYMTKYNNASDVLFGDVFDLSDEETDTYQNLKNEFNNIFTNKLETEVTEIGIGKRTESRELVYTLYDFTEKGSLYDIDTQIPAVNLNSDIVTECNTKIEELFKGKADKIATSNSNKHTIYSVKYVAYVNGNILSLVIKATLKEGENPQRLMIQTYNFDLNTGEEVSLEKILSAKKISLVSANAKIEKEIRESQAEVEKLKELGHIKYSRDVKNAMYKIENTENYFMGKDSYLYIIYAYGNSNYTTDKDIIIF